MELTMNQTLTRNFIIRNRTPVFSRINMETELDVSPLEKNWDICPFAEDTACISYRVACSDTKDPEIFDKFCKGNYQNCVRYKEKAGVDKK